MRALVKECSSTLGAVASMPQAAITSVTPPFPGLEPQIGTGDEWWQQSYNNRTSESDSSSNPWMPPEENSRDGSLRFL